MVIYLPAQAADDRPVLDELTPREIVRELDKYVIGQADAKRAVAIALRNRIRRQKLDPEMAEEVMPKNILMIGPTGVGKTELARRLAKLANSPFLKVEASKFTEVGYVGRDVESMIRDLVEISIDMVREERLDEVGERAERNAEERLLDLLMPAPARSAPTAPTGPAKNCARSCAPASSTTAWSKSTSRSAARRSKSPPPRGIEEMDINLKDVLPGLFGGRTQQAQNARRRSARLPGPGRRAEAGRHGPGHARRHRTRGAQRHHLPRRNRQDRRPRRRPRPRRQPRRRAARHPAHRRRHHRQHALRLRAHGSHSVHRRRRVPRLQAQRSDSGTAGPLPDPRGTEIAHRSRFHPHPEGAEERADQAVSGAARYRGHQADVHRGRPGGNCLASPRRSTNRPRTSARAACIRFSKSCSKTSPSTARISRRRT